MSSAIGQSLARALERVQQLVQEGVELEHHLELSSTIHASRPTAEPDPSLATLSVYLAEVRRLHAAAREVRQLLDEAISNVPSQTAKRTGKARRKQTGTVLVVDDSQDILGFFSVLLSAEMETVTATNGLEALLIAHNVLPSAIVMDLSMPILDGIAATRLLKASPTTRHIPVIAYTSTPQLCDRVAHEKLFACVLSKPAAPTLLVATLQKVIGADRRSAAPQEPL